MKIKRLQKVSKNVNWKLTILTSIIPTLILHTGCSFSLPRQWPEFSLNAAMSYTESGKSGAKFTCWSCWTHGKNTHFILTACETTSCTEQQTNIYHTERPHQCWTDSQTNFGNMTCLYTHGLLSVFLSISLTYADTVAKRLKILKSVCNGATVNQSQTMMFTPISLSLSLYLSLHLLYCAQLLRGFALFPRNWLKIITSSDSDTSL